MDPVEIELRTRNQERLFAIEECARALVDDVKKRHPGEELHCGFMRALDSALEDYNGHRNIENVLDG